MKDRKEIISTYDATQSIRKTAEALQLNRKTVTRYVNEYLDAKKGSDSEYTAYLKSEPTYKACPREKKVLTSAVVAIIDTCIEENAAKKARGDKKLCMKSIDIYHRVKKEGFNLSYSSVCQYVRKKTKKLEEDGDQECFIRQVYSPGFDCEFDWGELHLTIDGYRMKLYMAAFTLCYSNYRMAFLFPYQNTLAFLESHKLCFNIFSGVPHRMVYDNMSVAVKSFVGDEKLPTDALLRMERAYRFIHRFCNCRRGNEKGHVERAVEVVRRKAFCERDSFSSLEDANRWLYDKCMDMNMTPMSRETIDIIHRSYEDLQSLLPIDEYVEPYETRTNSVDKYSTVIVECAHYSVPDKYVGKKLNLHVFAGRIVVYDGRTIVAEHERTPHNGWKLDLMHYISTFEKKPGSVAGSAALAYALPDIKELFDDHFSEAPARFIALLRLVRDNGLTLEDLEVAHIMLEDAGINPATPGAFEQILLPKVDIDMTTVVADSSNSSEIEDHAMSGLHQLTQIMNDAND